VRLFLTACRFLTRLPLPSAGDSTPRLAAGSMVAFPLVGAILGVLLVLADAALRLLLPALPACALLLALWVALTGGLHLDGFIDCCDALWAAKPPAERLEILRDVHVGAYGVAGGALLLIVKFSALTALPAAWRWPLLLLAPLAARWAMVYATARYPYARRGPGLGLWFKEALRPAHLLGATLVAGILAMAVNIWLGPAMLLLAWLLTLALAAWTHSRLGGLTGDVYGMICEVIEPAILLAGVILAQFARV